MGILKNHENCNTCINGQTEECFHCESGSLYQPQIKYHHSNIIKSDMVHSPSHYTVGGIETIDFMKAKLSEEGFKGYLAGNILKYITRYKHKNGVEDLKKAKWYLDKLIQEMGD